jgi:hypothetical protein
VEAAEKLADLLDEINEFTGERAASGSFVDTDDGYGSLLAVVTSACALVVNASFSLPARRVITLDRDRNVIELAAELYGDPDRADDLIVLNKLNADEIEILPMGKEVSYYVQAA